MDHPKNEGEKLSRELGQDFDVTPLRFGNVAPYNISLLLPISVNVSNIIKSHYMQVQLNPHLLLFFLRQSFALSDN